MLFRSSLPTMVCRIFISKQAVTANARVMFSFGNSTSESIGVSVNFQAGTTILNWDDTGTVQYKIIESAYNSDYWELLISATTTDSLNNTVTAALYPARYDLDTTTVNKANTGSLTVGNVELYQNVTIAYIEGTDPVFTTS